MIINWNVSSLRLGEEHLTCFLASIMAAFSEKQHCYRPNNNEDLNLHNFCNNPR